MGTSCLYRVYKDYMVYILLGVVEARCRATKHHVGHGGNLAPIWGLSQN